MGKVDGIGLTPSAQITDGAYGVSTTAISTFDTRYLV